MKVWRMREKKTKRDGDRKLNGCIVGVEAQSSCCAPQWPALPSSSIIAFLGTHITVTSGSIAQLNVFSLPLLKGLCRAKPSWAWVTHNQPTLPPDHWHHYSSVVTFNNRLRELTLLTLNRDRGNDGCEQRNKDRWRERKEGEDKQGYGLTLSTHCQLVWQVSWSSNKQMTRNHHHCTAVTTLLIQRKTGQTVKSTYIGTGTFKIEPSCCGMKWGMRVCVCTSKTSFQQSSGSDSLLPSPFVLLKAPPIFSIHVCGVVIAQGTLALTHKHTGPHVNNM